MDLKKIHRQLFVIFTVLVLVTLPFSIRWCSISIILLTANWLVERGMKAKWYKLKQNRFIWLFSGFYILHIVGMLITEDVDNGIYDLEKKLSLFIFPIVIGSSERLSPKEVKVIFNAFVIACVTAVMVSLAFIFISGPDVLDPEHLNFDYLNKDKFRETSSGSSDIWNLLSYVSFGSFLRLHPTYFSLYIAFAIILMVYQQRFSFKNSTVLTKAVSVMALTVLITALVFLSSRIVIVSFTALCIILLGNFFFRKKKYLHAYIYSCALISIIALLIYINPVTRFRVIEEPFNTGFQYPNSNDNWNSWSLRLLQWNSSTNIIKNTWLTGVGTGGAQKYLNEEYNRIELGIFQSDFNAHNQYLQSTLNLGLIGFLWLVLSFFSPLIKSGTHHRKLFLSFIFLFGMCCLSESMLEVQKGVVFYSLFNSLLVFHVFHLNPEKYA